MPFLIAIRHLFSPPNLPGNGKSMCGYEQPLSDSGGVRNWTGGVSVPDEAPAWPAAYLAVREWLNNFPYRIDLGWPVFVLAGGAALVLAFATVGFLAFRAAAADPVESLRYE